MTFAARQDLGRDVLVIPGLALPDWWIERLDEPLRRLVAQTLAARYPVIED